MIRRRHCLKPDKKADTTCYIIGWCLLAAILVYALIQRTAENGLLSWPCLFHIWTGYYCPGCGGTRALRALFQGHFLTSFFCHPAVPAAVVIGGCFMLSQTAERLSSGRWRIGMHIRGWHFGLLLFLIGINFIVKNLFLIIWDIRLLQ